MRQDKLDQFGYVDATCRYGAARVSFRGPSKDLLPPFILCLGGTETFGRFITTPFPALIDAGLPQNCVNMGVLNGGVDTFLDDPAIMQICQAAALTIVQVMGAGRLTNRFYAVHPRRSDRFLRASPALYDLYPEVDFTSFAFTGDLLAGLYAVSPVRFEIVVHELRQVWLRRMRDLLTQLGGRSVLLWFSREPVTDCVWFNRPGLLRVEPLFISAAMIDRLRPLVRKFVIVNPSDDALAQGMSGAVVPLSCQAMAADSLGPACHAEAAAALIRVLQHPLAS